jgi:hypothetical protein
MIFYTLITLIYPIIYTLTYPIFQKKSRMNRKCRNEETIVVVRLVPMCVVSILPKSSARFVR